jgi:putative thioredoxin
MVESAWVKNVKEADFQREVIERSREVPVVVDFWAPWCGPCQALGPMLEALAAKRKGDFLLAKVNTDESPELAYQYRIEGIPAVKAFRDGRPVLEFVGLLSEPQLREFIDRICPSPSDRQARQAADLEASDPAAAEDRYRAALEQDPRNEAAVVGLARLLIARGQDAEASDLLGRVAPTGELGVEADRLGDVLWLRETARDCGDEATVRKQLAAEPDNAEARYRLGCLLAAQGKYAEALQTLLEAAQRDRRLAADKVRPVMVKVFYAVGVRSSLADEYRDKLASLLY